MVVHFYVLKERRVMRPNTPSAAARSRKGRWEGGEGPRDKEKGADYGGGDRSREWRRGRGQRMLGGRSVWHAVRKFQSCSNRVRDEEAKKLVNSCINEMDGLGRRVLKHI